MELSIYAYIAFLLLAALLSTRLMKLIKLPNVTGYLLTGIIMGPFVFGLLFNDFTYDGIKDAIIYQHIDHIKWVSTVALGFIAFSIGTSFKFNTIKAVGKRVLVITVLEASCASILVIGALTIAHILFPNEVPWEMVLTLGAIASATAPAATLMVIKQYKARGPLVNTLLPVVALDDAAALILFAILFQIANAMSGGGDFDLYKMLGKPLLEIAMSIGFGLVVGLLIGYMNKYFKSRNNRLIWCIFSVFAALGIYYTFQNKECGGFELSSLLMCMMIGAVYTNMEKESGRTLDVVDRFTSPIYMMFFVISGATLDVTIFFNDSGLTVLGIAAVYLIVRVVGKWLGAFTGACITDCEPQIKKYLGFALVPQAGVAIGLATIASQQMASDIGNMIIAVILTSTIIYELIGPMISKFALAKAGEIPEDQ